MTDKKLGVQDASKGRALNFIIIGIVAIVAIIGAFYLLSEVNVFGSSTSSSLQSTVPNIQSNPGVGDPSEAYARLIQDKNEDVADQAARGDDPQEDAGARVE